MFNVQVEFYFREEVEFIKPKISLKLSGYIITEYSIKYSVLSHSMIVYLGKRSNEAEKFIKRRILEGTYQKAKKYDEGKSFLSLLQV